MVGDKCKHCDTIQNHNRKINSITVCHKCKEEIPEKKPKVTLRIIMK